MRAYNFHSTARNPGLALPCLIAFLACLTATSAIATDHSGTITVSETWSAAGNPHIVTATVTVNAGVTLTIGDGAEVYFHSNGRINNYGTLTAVGTSGNGILFTSNGAFLWYGLRFLTSGEGTMEYCTFENASNGIDATSSGTISVANTIIRDGGTGIKHTNGVVQLTSVTIVDHTSNGINGTGAVPTFMDTNILIDNCTTGIKVANVAGLNLSTATTVRNNTTVGLHIDNCNNPTVNNMTLTGNSGAKGAMLMADTGEFTLGGGNTIGGTGLENTWPLTITSGSYAAAGAVIPASGNTNNDIQVTSGSSDRDGTWRKFSGLDYIVTATPTVSAGGELIIADDLIVRFHSNGRINNYGTLTAVGTSGNGILFTSNGAFLWYGLRFLTSGEGTFEYCTFELASSGIDLASTGTVTIAQSIIRDGGYGVKASNGTVEFLNTQIINNSSYGVYLNGGTPVFGNSLAQWNDIYGNGTGQAGRNLRNGATDITAEYVYWGVTNSADIDFGIWDELDDEELGLVDYVPWSNEAHDGAISAVDDVETQSATPSRFAFHQNYPNPFNASTVIRFDLDQPMQVRLVVYDVSGALVSTLVDDLLPADFHAVNWHGRDMQGRRVSSGVYFFQLTAGRNLETRKTVLVQ